MIKTPNYAHGQEANVRNLLGFFLKTEKILIEALLKHKIAKDLNDIVSKLFAKDDFEPSADQVKRKFQDILNKNIQETKAGL